MLLTLPLNITGTQRLYIPRFYLRALLLNGYFTVHFFNCAFKQVNSMAVFEKS